MELTGERRITPRESEVLHFLLGIDAPPHLRDRIAELRVQAASARVVERWECCPSITFAPPAEGFAGDDHAIVEARHHSEPYELILFVDSAGSLRHLEIVHHAADTLDEFPGLDGFEAPTGANRD